MGRVTHMNITATSWRLLPLLLLLPSMSAPELARRLLETRPLLVNMCVAACCSMLQRVAAFCRILECAYTHAHIHTYRHILVFFRWSSIKMLGKAHSLAKYSIDTFKIHVIHAYIFTHIRTHTHRCLLWSSIKMLCKACSADYRREC